MQQTLKWERKPEWKKPKRKCFDGSIYVEAYFDHFTNKYADECTEQWARFEADCLKQWN